MNTTQYREHLERVHSSYSAMVEGDRLEELDRELVSGTWMPSTNGSAPSEVVVEVTNNIMAELHTAAAKRDKTAARTALTRLRRLIRMIPEGFVAR
jgi:hypothetical protein